jgi:DNA-binding NtrC family response regulator
MRRIERQLVCEALAENDGNQTRTAEKLGISRQGLIKKMNQYGIKGRSGTAK